MSALLAAECDTLCRYLTGREAPRDVVRHYTRAHELGLLEPPARLAASASAALAASVAAFSARPPQGLSRLDRLLVLLARSGPQAAALADSVAVVYAKKGLLRRKLVLLLAILESARSTWRGVDTVEPQGLARFFFSAALAGAGFVLRAAAGLLVLGALALAEPLLTHDPAEGPAS